MPLVNIKQGHKLAAFFSANPTIVLLDGQILWLKDNSGTFKKGDGVTQLSVLPFLGGVGSSSTPFELQSTISGPTLTLAHTPISRQGYYLNGQRCSIGVDKIILSIVGTLITFKPDEDFTGMDFTETYDY